MNHRPVVPHALLDAAELKEIHETMRATVPGFRIVHDKASSRFMRVLAFILRPFNPRFMTDFTTTIAAVMYVPIAWWKDAPSLRRVSCHEWVHELRAMRAEIVLGPTGSVVVEPTPRWRTLRRAWWSWLYLFPQSLAPLALLAVLAWPLGAGWLWWLVALAALAPWPAPFRVREELAAYVVSIRLTPASKRDERRSEIVKTLTGSGYYWAAWRRGALAARLLEEETWPSAEARYVLSTAGRIRAELRGEYGSSG